MRMFHLFFYIFGEFQASPIGLEYEVQHVESFTIDPFGRKYSWNNATEDRGKKDHFSKCGHGLREKGNLQEETGKHKRRGGEEMRERRSRKQ